MVETVIVIIIIVAVVCAQIIFFRKNLLRMGEFSKIFIEVDSWRLKRNIDTGFVNGVQGGNEKNKIFLSILVSINKYLRNNSGSVIDFGILKDAVDRHCDSVEDEIATQMPIPLYCGLAGTMAGVIIGLFGLLTQGAIKDLLGIGAASADASAAADGVNSLLLGVALAMIASICGILLTTANSLLFKKRKSKEEAGKNSFLAWMQSVLLPELPTDTSEALNNLIKNLNLFNETFAENTSKLGDTLEKVNDSYATQAEIIEAVHDMDFNKMARANIRVLTELQQCTDKLEEFNQYLVAIKGYTNAIHEFEQLFNEEADRIEILEEIRDFFMEYKGSIAKTTADADNVLKTELKRIQDTTSENVEELNKHFVDIGEGFKKILEEEKDAFEQYTKDLRAQFSVQMSQMPQLVSAIEKISFIPVRIDNLIDKIERSNINLANNISKKIDETLGQMGHGGPIVYQQKEKTSIPKWMRFTGWLAIVIIALACIFNVVLTFFPLKNKKDNTKQTYIQYRETPVHSPSTSEINAQDLVLFL